MLLKTIEFVPSDISLTVASLQTQLDEGKYDDILTKFNFFTITEKGLTLVKQDKTIVINATVDLSNYVTKQTGYSLVKDSEIEKLATLSKYGDDEVNTLLATKNYLTEHQSLDEYAKLVNLHEHDNKNILDSITAEKIAAWDAATGGSNIDLTNYALKSDIPDVSSFITSIPDEYVTNSELESKGYLTEHQSLDDYAKTSDIPDISNLVSNDVLNSMFTIDESGNLIVTINGVTQTYAPITV